MMVVSAVLNHLLAQREDLRADLARHAGRVGCVQVGITRSVLAIDPQGYLAASDASPEATIALSAFLLPRLLLNDPSARREVVLSGDATLAADLAHVLQQIDWDAEGDLARLIGDIPAHRLAESGRRLFGEPAATLRNLAETLTEFIQEEARLLVTRPSAERFLADVDDARDHLARLEARLIRLEKAAG
ncbi:MAG: hypothetical protein JO142_03545 [Burkholderiales bacterium]|nr:hypothetical protein [Burkholderiales bacterium]